jgi:hypothetical protein
VALDLCDTMCSWLAAHLSFMFLPPPSSCLRRTCYGLYLRPDSLSSYPSQALSTPTASKSLTAACSAWFPLSSFQPQSLLRTQINTYFCLQLYGVLQPAGITIVVRVTRFEETFLSFRWISFLQVEAIVKLFVLCDFGLELSELHKILVSSDRITH